MYRWEFAQRGRWFEVIAHGKLTTNDAELMIRAALDRVGLAYVLEAQVCEHLAAGRLIKVLEAWLPAFPGFYLYYPSRFQIPPKRRVFIDFARERLA